MNVHYLNEMDELVKVINSKRNNNCHVLKDGNSLMFVAGEVP